jgi:hypothetical protein
MAETPVKLKVWFPGPGGMESGLWACRHEDVALYLVSISERLACQPQFFNDWLTDDPLTTWLVAVPTADGYVHVHHPGCQLMAFRGGGSMLDVDVGPLVLDDLDLTAYVADGLDRLDT